MRQPIVSRTKIVQLFLGIFAAGGAALGQVNWVQQLPATNPVGREAAAMTYDQARQQVVLFGGCGSSNCFLSDTWAWDGHNWLQKTPSTIPPGRYRPCLIYDPQHQQVVLFGGEGLSATLNDTWVWDGSNWAQKTSATAPPAEDCHASFAYDELHQQAIYVTGDPTGNTLHSQTWLWDGSTWTHLSPTTVPPFSSTGLLAYDRARQQLVLATYTDNPNNNNFVSTWTWDGSNWNRKPDVGTPLPFDQNPSQAVYDAAHQQVLVVLDFQRTYSWNGTGWTQLSPATSPPPRILASMAFDEFNGQVVLFGGSAIGDPSVANDTWTYGNAFPSVNITVPAGVQFMFNGVSYTGSQSIPIAQGNYTLATTSSQSTAPGTQMVFTGWSDSGAISHSVNVGPAGLSITGSFTTRYNLTVTANPSNGGAVSGSGFYDSGSIAAATATPNSGFTFANWSGACSGSGACNVTMNAPASVTANFNAALVQLTINVPASVQYSFNGANYTGTQVINLAPGPYPLSVSTPQASAAGTQLVFTSWSDGGTASHNVTLSGVTQSVIGTFKTQYLLTAVAAPLAGGEVAPVGPPGPYFDAGTAVNVASAANPGYQFEYWSGACGGSASICTVLMNAPQTVVGNFIVPPMWIQLGPVNTPTARYLSAAAYDANHSEMVLFGGFSRSTLQFFNETWTWNGSDWTLKHPANSPSARSGHAMGYDVVNQQVVLFGAGVLANETWVWDGANWTPRTPAHAPTGRAGAKMAWDGSRLILFGGFTTSGMSNESWAWSGTDWTLLAPANKPPGRQFASMTYDAARNQILLFGGETVNNGGFIGDTWVWTGSNWVQKAPAASPSARSRSNVAYHGVLQQVVLFSGFGAAFPDEVWLWDGNNWKQRAESPSPRDEDGGAIVYDSARQQMVLLTAFSGETWLYTNNVAQQYFTLSTTANPAGVGTVSATAFGQAGPVFRAGSNVTLTASANVATPFQYWSGACSGSSPCVLRLISNQSATANYGPQLNWVNVYPATKPFSAPTISHSFFETLPLAYDTARQQIVLFGGSYGGNAYGNETWVWDGVTWTKKTPAHSPPARSGHGMAYDEARQVVVLFGGESNTVPMNDTWTWDGSDWTPRASILVPPVRSNHALAYDGARQQVVLYGGWDCCVGGGGNLTDTWLWDGSQWTGKTTAHNPGSRTDFGMAYDTIRQNVVLFSGIEPGPDTWTWNGTDWTLRAPATSPPKGFNVAAWDSVRQRVLLFAEQQSPNAQTWNWDGTNWTKENPPTNPSQRFGVGMAYDAARQRMTMFGGTVIGVVSETWLYTNTVTPSQFCLTLAPSSGGTLQVAGGGTCFLGGTWLTITATPAAGNELEYWTGPCAGSLNPCNVAMDSNKTVGANFGLPLSWLQLNPATSAAPKSNLLFENPIALAYDGARHQVVYFGGSTGGQTWTWNGATWTLRNPANSPPPRAGHAMAYDEARQRVILFGGGNGVALRDTWAWDGTNWTLVDNGTGPGRRFNHGMAYDRARQEIVMFGGVDENLNFYADTWVWNGTQWILRLASQGPTLRSDFAMAFDAPHGNVVLYGGVESGTNNTWLWNGTSWTQTVAISPTPGVGFFSLMAFDEHLQRMILFVETTPPQTWTFDGYNWSQLAPTVSPAPRIAGGLAYDGVRGQVLLFGGDGPPLVPLNDTWVFSPPAVILVSQGIGAVKDASGNYLVTAAIKNTGNTSATQVFGFSATLTDLATAATYTTNQFTTAQFVTIAPGATVNFTAKFPPVAGPGTRSFSIQGSYSAVNVVGGSWSAAVRALALH